MILDAQAMLRHGQHVMANDQIVGEITSGVFSPMLKKSIAFARINAQALTQPLHVEIRGKLYSVSQHALKFYNPQTKEK